MFTPYVLAWISFWYLRLENLIVSDTMLGRLLDQIYDLAECVVVISLMLDLLLVWGILRGGVWAMP